MPITGSNLGRYTYENCISSREKAIWTSDDNVIDPE